MNNFRHLTRQISLVFFPLIASVAFNIAIGQINACGVSGGQRVAGVEYGKSVYGVSGDVTLIIDKVNPSKPGVPATADWYLASTADVDVYGAVTIPAGSMMALENGAVLNVYGDIINDGEMYIEPGATINFYGNTWKNSKNAIVGDGATMINSIPGGTVNFLAARLSIDPSYLLSGTCPNYGGGNTIQLLDGGNVPMDIVLHIKNNNNIKLINSNTKIEGSLKFDVADGDIDLGNNSFIFTKNGTWETTIMPNEAFFITNGTNDCAGAVVKEALAPGAVFIFPVGQRETYAGARDFTPALIRNDGVGADDFQALVKNYGNATSAGNVIINVPQKGIDRVWQIRNSSAGIIL